MKNQYINFLRLQSKIDAVCSRLSSAVRMNQVPEIRTDYTMDYETSFMSGLNLICTLVDFSSCSRVFGTFVDFPSRKVVSN